MEVKQLSKEGNKISFIIKNTDSAFANTIRRLILDEVPTMAIEDVEFKDNDSVLYDEIVAHRLGLIPLKTDLKHYSFPSEDLQGETSASTHVTFTLKTKASGMIDTSKLKSNDPAVVPVYENIPITLLNENQQLEFTAVARLGRGKEHAKWSPAHVWFVQESEVTINDSSQLEDFREKYPPQAFNSAGKLDKKTIESNPSLVDACEGVCEDVLKVSHNPNNFIFNLESWGQLAPKEIVERAVFEMTAKMDEFKSLLTKLD